MPIIVLTNHNNERLFKQGCIMGIGSVGVGSGILTQDVLDQLRKADEASRIRPIDFSIANEKDKQAAFDVIKANMKNLSDAIGELASGTLYDNRSVDIDGDSIKMSVDANADEQEFSIDVSKLATKQIEESGSFASQDTKIATASGSLTLNVNGKDYTINYDDTTTLKDLKNSINTVAGEDIDATIVQVADDDFRLVLSSTNTGANQDITLSDNDGNLSDDGGTSGGGTKLTSDFSDLQTGEDAQFTFNGQSITRSSNNIDDLITGYHITLKQTGVSNVNVTEDRDEILSRIDSFVEKYNSAIDELDKMTKASTDASERGIFSNESTIKGLKSTIQNMVESVGGGVGMLYDYGFDIDKEGKLSVDKTVINDKLDNDSANFQAFFSGGTFLKDDSTTVEVDGAFSELGDILGTYTKTGGMLDNLDESMDEYLSELQDRKTDVTQQLDSRYAILKKKFTAYDIMISKLNSASNMFIQMANAQIDAQKH